MQNLLAVELVKRAARSQICPRCYQRPHGSENLSSDHSRACEANCPFFLNIPHLMGIATFRDPMVGSYERDIKRFICEKCTRTPSSGDFCSEYENRTCPLSRYGREMLELITILAKK